MLVFSSFSWAERVGRLWADWWRGHSEPADVYSVIARVRTFLSDKLSSTESSTECNASGVTTASFSTILTSMSINVCQLFLDILVYPLGHTDNYTHQRAKRRQKILKRLGSKSLVSVEWVSFDSRNFLDNWQNLGTMK